MNSLVSIIKAPLIIAASMLSVEIATLVFDLADSFVIAILYGMLFFVAVAFLLIYAWFDVLEFLKARRIQAFLPSALNFVIAIAFIALSSLLIWIFPGKKADAIPQEHGITFRSMERKSGKSLHIGNPKESPEPGFAC